MCGCLKAAGSQSNVLVEFQVKDEGGSEGLHQEAALGQMDVLGDVKNRRMETRISCLKKHHLPSRKRFFTSSNSDLVQAESDLTQP